MEQSYVPCVFLVRSPEVPRGEIHSGSERPNENMQVFQWKYKKNK